MHAGRSGLILGAAWLALLAGRVAAWGEAPPARAEVRPAAPKVVQGEMVRLKVRLTWNQPVALPRKPTGMDANLWVDWRLPGGETRSYATGKPPEIPWQGPAYRPEPGRPEAVEVELWPCDPGTHRIRVRYRVSPEWQERGDFWKGEAVSEWAEVEVTAPQGPDEEVWKAYRSRSPKADCMKFFFWATYPPNDLLTRFPTSTYAGYVLLSLPTNSTPISCALDALDASEETWKGWADRGGSEEQVRQRILEAKAILESYAEQAGQFLAAHPNFGQASRIRRAYAISLGLTGRMPEALEQIKFLAQGGGKEADEARAYLEAKARK